MLKSKTCEFEFCLSDQHILTFPSPENREKFDLVGRLFLPSLPLACCLQVRTCSQMCTPFSGVCYNQCTAHSYVHTPFNGVFPIYRFKHLPQVHIPFWTSKVYNPIPITHAHPIHVHIQFLHSVIHTLFTHVQPKTWWKVANFLMCALHTTPSFLWHKTVVIVF